MARCRAVPQGEGTTRRMREKGLPTMRKFKTESKKLLNLMINSIYTNREIFLRELVSNASDAVDKLYFRSLTDKDVEVGKDDLAIRVSFDKDAQIGRAHV